MIRLPQLNPTTIGAPLLNPQTSAAPAEALGTLAQSIAGVSQYFHDTAVNVQKAENARLESTYRMQWGEGLDKLRLELQKEPDPQKRIDGVNTYLRDRKDAWHSEDLPPAVKDRLALQYDEFASNARTAAAADASRLSLQRASLALGNEIARAKSKGAAGRQDFERAITTAEESVGLPPEEKERLQLDFDRSLSGTTIDLALQEDPALVLEDVDRPDFLSRVPGFTPEDLPKIRSAARQSVQRMRSEQMDVIEGALNAGILTAKDLEAADYLTASDVSRVKKALVTIDPPSSETHAEAWSLLLANRAAFADKSISDQEYAALWNDLRSELISMVPAAYSGDLNQELNYRSPANRIEAKTKPRASSEKQELKSVAIERITRARSANLLGNVDEDADPVVREKAYRRAEELRILTARFIEETPDLTLDKVTEFTDGLISGDRVKTSARDFQNFIPGGAQRLRPLPSMAPGPGFSSDALLPKKELEDFLK